MSVYFEDSFEIGGGNTEGLEAHTPVEVGTSYIGDDPLEITVYGDASGSGDAGYVSNDTNLGVSHVLGSDAEPDTAIDASLTFRRKTTNAGHYTGLVVRDSNVGWRTAGNAAYTFSTDNDGSWKLTRRVNVTTATNLGTTLASGTFTPTIAQCVLRVTIENNGSGNPVINCWMDGSPLVVDYEDTSASKITAAGRTGFILQRTQNEVEYFVAETLATGAINTVTLTDYAMIIDRNDSINDQRRPGDRVETIEDAIFLYTVIGGLLYESFEVDDAIRMEQNLRRNILDLVSVEDSIAYMRAVYAEVYDAVTLVDSIKKTVTIGDYTQTFVITVEEALLVSDAALKVFTGISQKTPTDSLSIVEYLALSSYRHRQVFDELATGDAWNKIQTKLLRESFRVSDRMDVTRSAIVNTAILSDAVSVVDYSKTKSGTLLPDSAQIEIAIESLGIILQITVLDIETGIEIQ